MQQGRHRRGGPGRRARGGGWGAPEHVVCALVRFLGSLKNLTMAGDEGGGGGGWAREAGKGGRWGAPHQRAVWEQRGVRWLDHLAGDEGGGGGRRGGGGPGRRSKQQGPDFS